MKEKKKKRSDSDKDFSLATIGDAILKFIEAILT
jgi:hypothetical protein